jgi:LysR family glycine cleavage system transcriptional activator
LPGIREGFAQLAAAVSQAKPQARVGRLTVSVAPSFAAKWLLPRLSDFERRHPEIDVHVDASMPLVDLHDGSVDVAIRYGSGQYPGLRIERLLGEEVFPVCSPELFDGGRPLSTPQDLAELTLLHDDSPDNDPSCPTWPMWLRAAGVHGIDATRGPHFSQSSLVIEAAVLGRGIALAKSTIAAADLAAGRIRRLFEVSVPLAFAYYLVYTESASQSPKVAAFRQWLFEQVGRE